MAPRVLQIRRLVIAEAVRFPGLGQYYWEQGIECVLDSLAEGFARFGERGRLAICDPAMAANHFVGLTLWIVTSRVMFFGRVDVITTGEAVRFAAAAAERFLAAYRPYEHLPRPT